MSDVAMETHYTVFELAKIWKVSHMTVRRWCESEPDLLRYGSEESRYGRRRIFYRIPESVAIRMYRKRQTR